MTPRHRMSGQCRLRFQGWLFRRSPTGPNTYGGSRVAALRPRGRVVTPTRPRNSFGPSYRPPHGARRRRSASVVARLGGGAACRGHAPASRRARVSHHRRRAAGPPAHDQLAFGAIGCARGLGDRDELGPCVARVRRLAHSRSPGGRQAVRNLSIENTVPRLNM